MKLSHKIMALTLTTALPFMAATASAEQIIKKTTTMNDGTEVTVTKTTDVDKAANSMEIKTTTYSYDKNKDGYFDNNEVITYVTKYADTNNDGFIDAEEYESGSMTYFSNMMSADNTTTEPRSYSYWDKDKNNRLDSSELETLVENKGFYKQWDVNKDGKIDNAEFSQATFKAYDDDSNGMISMQEWMDVVM